MKKAKILVPAIAALVLSSAAAVTGTVAWFTSTRTASITGSPVTVINTSAGNLSTVLTKGLGVSAVDSTQGTVTHSTLTDGSVDLDGVVGVYAANDDATEYVNKTVDFAGPAGTNSFRATKFTIAFTYTFEAGNINNDTATIALLGTSSVTKKPADALEPEIAPALRIGFKTTTSFKVWAPFRHYADLTGGLEYASGAGEVGSNKGKYAQTAIINEADTTASSTQNDLGAIVDKQADNTLSVDVYTWFEGCDPTCVNGKSLMEGYEIKLNFTAKLSKA